MRVELEKQAWVLDEIGEVESVHALSTPRIRGLHPFPQRTQSNLAGCDRRFRGRRRLERVCPTRVGNPLPGRNQPGWPPICNKQRSSPKKGKNGGVYRLRVPIDHTEMWYSVLNQARLILNEDHEIARTERGLLSGDQLPTAIDEENGRPWLQYRIYGTIQEFLLAPLDGG